MEILNLPEKEEKIEPKFPQKREGDKGRWMEIEPITPYFSALQRYLDFSHQFFYALPVASLEELDSLDAKNGDVVKFEDKWFMFEGVDE